MPAIVPTLDPPLDPPLDSLFAPPFEVEFVGILTLDVVPSLKGIFV
jgi:hypothetical protein